MSKVIDLKENQFLTKNVTLSVKEIENLMAKWNESKKSSQIAASFSNVLELEEKHLKHFKGAPYIWKPLAGGTVWGGMLVDDSIDYIHLVLATKDVLDYILNL